MNIIERKDTLDPFGRIGGQRKSILDEERKHYFIQNASRQIPLFVKVHKAWTLMLIKQEVISAERGKKILEALYRIDERAITEMIQNWDPSGWEPMMQLERYLTAKIGQIASDVNIARTIPPPFYRMELADLLIGLIEATISFRKILLKNASAHVSTVMPGYTHLQHAQPTTYGHYLLGFFDAVDRASLQVEQAYSKTNRFELGCGALSGTSFDIDRQMPADLLGFDGLVEHSNDAVAATDFIVDCVAALTNLMIPLSRVANDLDIWSSFEFGMVEIADHLTNPSSMMPQKKNPAIFEICRMALGQILGSFGEIVCSAHAVPYGDVIEMRELAFKIHPTIREVIRVFALMGEGIDTLIVHKEMMLKHARAGFSTVTELAALLYREANIPLRMAHGIVAEVVRTCLAEGRLATEVSPELVKQAALKVTGKTIRIDSDPLESALDPSRFVEVHDSQGGVAPSEVNRMIKVRDKDLTKTVERQAKRLEKLHEADSELNRQVERILNSRGK
ncbi:MAG: argininosuccinate lyase [Spirochaetaceae bacterium]|nr:MAG: argininosuccinate lyase [Spirochaetaceae bacterium]